MKRTGLAFLGLSLLVCTHAALADEDPRRQNRRTPVVEVIEHCRDGVVNISTQRIVPMRAIGPGYAWDDVFDLPRPRNQRVQSVGSGAVVHEDGYIVTNAHVVSRASNIQVTFADGRTENARPIAVDAEHDLAVIKVDADHPLKAIKLGQPDDVMIGETVVAIGNPLGLQHTATAGIVSAVGRDVTINEDVAYRGLIQTDTPINPGNSGGPLLNVNDELIGINSAIRGDAQAIGFAIPVARLWELLPDLLDIEKQARVRFGLGVSGADARVVEVRPDTPAAKAGIKTDDRVVRLNDRPVRDGIDYYVLLREQKPDQPVRLELKRGKETVNANVVLETVPPPDGAALVDKLFGMRLEEITPEYRRRNQLSDDIGLIVRSVKAGSPADRAEIKRGDYIVRIDRAPVRTLEDVGLLLETVPSGKRIHVQGVREEADWRFIWGVWLAAK